LIVSHFVFLQCGNVQALLQVGYFITVSPVMQLGFILLMKLRTLLGIVRQGRSQTACCTQPLEATVKA
jgi:hypothetical protein